MTEALRLLNRKTPHRFTGVFLFDPPHLNNHALVDSWDTAAQPMGPVPMEQTFCGLMGSTRQNFVTASAVVDARLSGHHLAHNAVQSYCGALLRDEAGDVRGTVCHWDLKPCDFAPSTASELEAAARLITQLRVA